MIIRNLFFYLGLIPPTILFTLFGVSFFFAPFKVRYWIITRWSHFFIFWAKITCGLHYKVNGLENLPQQNAIVLSNHQSVWETIFMQVLLPPQTWILKKELLHIPVFGWGLALLEPIAINRKDPASIKELLHQGKEKLQKDRWVIIFPEGTRVVPGEEKKFSRSGAALAHAVGSPIVPIAHNAGLFWPRGFFIKKPGTIQVVIGSVIFPDSKSIDEINEIAKTWINKQLKSLKYQDSLPTTH